MILDALNIGLMTALLKTPKFVDYNAVCFSVNYLIREETMNTGSCAPIAIRHSLWRMRMPIAARSARGRQLK